MTFGENIQIIGQQKSTVNQHLAGVNIGCKKIRGFPHPNDLLG